MELKVRFGLESNRKLREKFSPELIALIEKAREVAIACGSHDISTIHFFIADCELKNEGSLYHLFYTDDSLFAEFKKAYIKFPYPENNLHSEDLFLEEEVEHSLDSAEVERISRKQALIYPSHFFISALTQRFCQTRFYNTVKETPDIVEVVIDYYKKKGVFKLAPMNWEERNIHYLGPGLNETILTTGNLGKQSEVASSLDALAAYPGINTDALFTLKHHFDLLLLQNMVSRSSTSRPDVIIISEQDFWNKAINGLLYPGQIVQMLDFKLFEWMSASPGITHSSYHKNYATEKRKRFEERLDAKPRDLRKIVSEDDEGEEDRFITAGTKAIRLAPKIIHNELQHVVTATSQKSPVSGIPITMNASYYSELVGLMKGGKEIDVNITGRLMVLPSELSPIRIKYERSVPKFFVEVFEIQKLPLSQRPGTLIGPDITLSVTYAKRSQDSDKVTFHRITDGFKNKPGEVHKTIERLRERASKDSGEAEPIIIGDFDEFFDHFENVEFPIKEMANGRFSMTKLLLYKDIFGIKINELYMGDKNIINNSVVGAVGSNATASNNAITQNNFSGKNELNYDLLKEELAKLRAELSKHAQTPEEYRAIGLVASAELAASEKDGNKIVAFLKDAGEWVFKTATKIGVNVVSEIFKNML